MAVNTVPQEGIYRFGTEEQKKRLLTPLARGEWLGGIGFTEADTGSDPGATPGLRPTSRNTKAVSESA